MTFTMHLAGVKGHDCGRGGGGGVMRRKINIFSGWRMVDTVSEEVRCVFLDPGERGRINRGAVGGNEGYDSHGTSNVGLACSCE